jgi:protein CpxP
MKSVGIIAVFLMLGTLVFAQDTMPEPPGPHHGPMVMYEMHNQFFGKWWKNSEVVKDLQLTDAQLKQIEQTFLDYRLKLIDLHADLERQETKLQPLMDADVPNEQQISTQVDAVVAARAKLEKTNTMMMVAIRRTLSVEQWKKLQEFQQKHMHEQRFLIHHGPDGPMHHGEPMELPPPPPGKE